ncbi:MAG: YtxH domain-containing protein [Smithella sp.]
MAEGNDNFLKGLIIGGLIGAFFGFLYAPKSGKETREDIARSTEELLDKARNEYERTIAKSKSTYESTVKRLQELEASAKEKVEEAENKVSEFAEQGAETIQNNKNRLKDAINAGIEAYKEEKAGKVTE